MSYLALLVLLIALKGLEARLQVTFHIFSLKSLSKDVQAPYDPLLLSLDFAALSYTAADIKGEDK